MLHQGFGAATADGFGEQITVGVGFAQELGDGFGDDEAGFGVQPAIQPPPAVEGFGQVDMLGGVFAGRLVGGLLGGGGGEEFFGDDPQLPWCQRRRLLGEERLEVGGEIVLQLLRRLHDHPSMIQTEVTGPERFSGDRHPIRQRPPGLHPLGYPAIRLTRQLPRTNACVDAAPSMA